MAERWKGYATPEGTKRFQQRFEGTANVAAGHFRPSPDGLMLSSLGMGSYLGDPDPTTDASMEQAVRDSVSSGAVNVLDTAINYRNQASERSFGKALKELLEAQIIQRDEVFLCSKNGFISMDAAITQPFPEYFKETFIDTGIIQYEDIAGGMHCMSPSFLNDQLNRSLSNLGVETLDLMYLHNAAETQIPEVGREKFVERLQHAFEFYEKARSENRIRYYGMATWDCFRVTRDHMDRFLSLDTLITLAEAIGGKDHGFRFIQIPYNMALVEAATLQNQPVRGEPHSLLSAAHTLEVGVFSSVPLMQGQLLNQVKLQFENLETPAQQCLQFVRSTPGILAPLVGHKQPAHVAENLKVASVPPLSAERFSEFFATQTA